MECRFSSDLLQLYVDGALEPLERIITEAHLKSCEHCQSLVADFRWIASLLAPQSTDPTLDRQLELMAQHTAQTLTGQPVKIGAKEIFRHQRNIAACATKFLKHVPGSTKAAELSKKGLQYAPKALWSVSRGLVAGGVRLAKVWA